MAARTTATQKTAAAKAAGPKPAFQVVEDTLKCQTENGELSLSLKIKFGVIRGLAQVSGTGDKFAEFDYIMQTLLTEEQNEALDDLDSADAAEILTEYASALATRLTARLGESKRSSTS